MAPSGALFSTRARHVVLTCAGANYSYLDDYVCDVCMLAACLYTFITQLCQTCTLTCPQAVPNLDRVPSLQELSTEVVALPRSSTGQQGYISVKALKMLQQLRESGAKVVIVTGARSSTLMERLPYLPAADAVVSENGGRIFYVDGSWSSFVPLREDMDWRAELASASGVHAAVRPPHAGYFVISSDCHTCSSSLSVLQLTWAG